MVRVARGTVQPDCASKPFEYQTYTAVSPTTLTVVLTRYASVLARFVRKTLSFSKSDKFHEFVFRLSAHHYNLAVIS